MPPKSKNPRWQRGFVLDTLGYTVELYEKANSLEAVDETWQFHSQQTE